MSYIILQRNELAKYGDADEFQGYQHGDTNVSFIWVELSSGSGPRLHQHPYEEVFVVQEGQAICTVGSTTLEVTAGHIVIVPPGVPHKFVSSGDGLLRQIDIHASPQFITEWLEG